MSKPTVLISGAGIAGPICAFWLTRAGIKTTIIERAPELRKAGQQIDIHGNGFEVIKRMGLEEAIRARTVKEAGLLLVDSNYRTRATFPVDKNGASLTREIEIIRAELSQILFDTTKNDTEYIFGDHVTKIEQGEGDTKASITFSSGTRREFDYTIGADGMGSKIRRLAFLSSGNVMKHLGQYISFFTIPFKEEDGTFGQWYNAPGGRLILLRPDGAGATRAYVSIMSTKPAGYYKLSVIEQKKMMRELFTDAGWQSLRVLDGMDKADDFYMQEIAQVKMPTWSEGRVTLLGDAGYCPSPISGMGTNLAIMGGYILAGEIAKHGMDYAQALKGYEGKMRPYVDKAQNLPPGAPAIVNPQSKWGIAVLYSLAGIVSWTRLPTFVGKLLGPKTEDKTFPKYDL